MDKEEILREIRSIFESTFPELQGVEFDYEKKLSHFENWDSLTQMELVGKIEQKFDTDFEFEELDAADCANKFVQLILSKKND
jgi:acyl carrier protein